MNNEEKDLNDLMSNDGGCVDHALAVFERVPKPLWNAHGLKILRKAIKNVYQEAVTDYEQTKRLERMVRLVGTIHVVEFTSDFNPFRVFLDVYRHERTTVRIEAFSTLIKLIRSCERYDTDLTALEHEGGNSIFFEVKNEMIKALEHTIRDSGRACKDGSEAVRDLAVKAYAILPRSRRGDNSLHTARERFLKAALSEEKNSLVRESIQRAID